MLNAFRSSGKKKGGNIIVWILLGLVIIGLTGFGLSGAVSGLASQNVARVGGEPVSREEFVRAMFRQLDAFGRQAGTQLTMSQAQAIGMDQQVLSRLVTVAALDREAKALKLSVGDRIVGDQLMGAQQFQGLSGKFDQQAYDFFLSRQGLSAKEYEEELREEAARALLQSAVGGGARMPDVLAQRVLAYLGEERGFDYVRITPGSLEGGLPAPDAAALQAHYDANPDDYTAPETRRVTYVALTPEDLVDTIEVTEDEVRAAYEDRAEAYNTPAARIVDQISFPSVEDAEAAKARIEAGEISFADLAAERDLTAADIARGRVTEEDLGAEARAAVFGTVNLGVVGPVTTDLGPALYRVNAVIPARTTAFEDVQDELRRTLALDAARNEIAEHIDPVQDLLASGATLQEIADETELTLGEADVADGLEDIEGIASDAAFRAEALTAEVDEERDLIDLTGGGIAALRVTAIDPPTLRPFDEVREQVASDWQDVEEQRAMTALAESLQAQIGEGRTFTAVAEGAGLTVESQPPIDRNATLGGGLPQGLLSEVFAQEATGETAIVGDATGVYLVQVSAIEEADMTSDEQVARLEQLNANLATQFGSDLFLAYAQLLTDTAGVEVNQQLIADTLAQYP